MESHGGAIFHIGPIGVTSAMVTMSAITLGLCLFAILSTRHLTERPGKAQNVAEKVVEMLLNFLTGIIGRENARAFLPFLGTIFLFILISNYSGILPLAGRIPGLAAPTSSLSITAALATCTFLYTHYVGIKRHGKHYIQHFTKPIIFMFPILLMEAFIRPLSLTLRLYGNIYGEEAVTMEIANLAPMIAPLALNALSLLLGFVQAMVFVMLSCVYISEAAGAAH